jgi:hypothetical protein
MGNGRKLDPAPMNGIQGAPVQDESSRLLARNPGGADDTAYVTQCFVRLTNSRSSINKSAGEAVF